MLSMLEQEKEVPWNAYVMTTESCDRLAQTEGNLTRCLEIIWKKLLENTSGIDQKAYPTLGMLYEERANHLETLYIPFVDIEGEQSGAVEDDTRNRRLQPMKSGNVEGRRGLSIRIPRVQHSSRRTLRMITPYNLHRNFM